MKFITDGTAEIVMHPVRFNILKLLRSADRPLYVQQIAGATRTHARLVSHHLDILEEEGLVQCTYELRREDGVKRGVAVRMCRPTERAGQALKDIREEAV